MTETLIGTILKVIQNRNCYNEFQSESDTVEYREQNILLCPSSTDPEGLSFSLLPPFSSPIL